MSPVKFNIKQDFNLYIDDILKQVRKGHEILVICDNTRYLSTSSLVNLLGYNITFRIISGLDKEKYNEDKYINRTTYTISEVYNIVDAFEKIEKNFKGTNIEKALYIYKILASFIYNNKEYQNSNNNEKNNLSCIYTRKAICSGYALIFKELMDRQNIKCDYVRGTTPVEKDAHHAWNVLNIDGQNIPLDLTWEASDYELYHHDLENNLKYFGSSNEFILKHIPDSDERLQSYKYAMTYDDVKIMCNSYKKNNNITYRVNRTDGTSFFLTKLGRDESGLYEYAYKNNISQNNLSPIRIIRSENDIEKISKTPVGISFFANELLKDARVELNVAKNSYVGYINKDENTNEYRKYYNEKNTDQPIFANYTRSDLSNFCIIYNKNEQKDLKAGIFSYDIYEYINTKNGVVLEKKRIYSSSNLININDPFEKQFIADEFLSYENLQKNNHKFIGAYYFDPSQGNRNIAH